MAETLAEFRDNYRYNLRDTHVRACQADVPISPNGTTTRCGTTGIRPELPRRPALHGEGRRRARCPSQAGVLRIHHRPRVPAPDLPPRAARPPLRRLLPRPPQLPRPEQRNLQPALGPDAALLGPTQLDWLEAALRRSEARWKIICCDMPLGLLVGDAANGWEACSNGDHALPRGRELEIARLLSSLRRNRVRNLVWLTADVHYAAAHYYNPGPGHVHGFRSVLETRQQLPLHAGTRPAGSFDRTFGPTLRWSARPPGAPQNLPPSANEQYFGTVRIEPRNGVATVTQYNRVEPDSGQ